MGENTEPVYIVDYAYGFNPQTCQPDYISNLRTRAALRVLKKYPDARIVLGADMHEETGGCGPLAEMTRSFLHKHGVNPSHILLNPKGTNTLAETEAAYALIRKNGFGKIFCTTSAFHAPRVWLIWLLRYGIIVRIYSTKHKPRLSEWIHETWKIFRDVARIFLGS